MKNILIFFIVCLFSSLSLAAGKYTSENAGNGSFVVSDVNVNDQDFYESVTLQFNFAKGTFKVVDAKPQDPQTVKNAYFYVRGAKTVDGKLLISGDYITSETIEAKNSGGNPSASKQPPAPTPISIQGRFQVKWILPPQDSLAYGPVKDAAQGAGYETVEHNDFSYP